MSRLVFVCRTCDRNVRVGPGELTAGERLARRIRSHLGGNSEQEWAVREVACLNGCLRPANISFRGAGRFTFRFGALSEADVSDILAFGEQYWASKDGEIPADRIPEALRARMTVCTPPLRRWQ